MSSKLTDKLSILRTSDHFRDWHTLDDERLCALCNREFTGHEVVISMVGGEVGLHCPTPDCESRVHQWVHPANPHFFEKNQQDWWHAIGSNCGPDNAGSAPSPQPV